MGVVNLAVERSCMKQARVLQSESDSESDSKEEDEDEPEMSDDDE